MTTRNNILTGDDAALTAVRSLTLACTLLMHTLGICIVCVMWCNFISSSQCLQKLAPGQAERHRPSHTYDFSDSFCTLLSPQIVNVKRGYARTLLVPSGVAVYGTLWENIDRFADPAVISREAEIAQQSAKAAETHPTDWINE